MTSFALMDIKLKLGLRIKELRELSGMSQKDLAFDSDLDRSYIAGIENGKRNVSIANIEKIALALKTNIRTFFNSSDFS